MNNKAISLVLIFLASTMAYPIDLDVKNKYGNGSTIYESSCNKDTLIDFYMSSDSVVSFSSGTPTLTKASSSKMKFMDVRGKFLDFTLNSVVFTDQNLVTKFSSYNPIYFVLSFQTSGAAEKLHVIIPILQSDSGADSRVINVEQFDDVYANLDG